MGAWGYLPFENDDALDWLDELESGGADVIRGALAKVDGGYVEAPEGNATSPRGRRHHCRLPGQPVRDLPENVSEWVTTHGAELTALDVELALEAVGRVAGEESELAELWDDADEPEWRESLEDLAERLRSALR
jgi:hypothetical protein